MNIVKVGNNKHWYCRKKCLKLLHTFKLHNHYQMLYYIHILVSVDVWYEYYFVFDCRNKTLKRIVDLNVYTPEE